jgi:magnesium and cobalt transporter
LERLSAFLMRAPEDREQLLQLLHGAFERNLLDADALSITEGALAVSDIQVRDVMVPRAQMDVISIHQGLDKITEFVIEATHSRFPVIGEDKDDIVGILLAKDLLRHAAGGRFDLRAVLRPAVFIPESKRLNVLLREFRASRNHMAIVVDEYGGVSGLVTIEDVLEQIVGDIDDELDPEEASSIQPQDGGRYIVLALARIEEFNEFFNTELSDADYDTVGGLVMHELGRLPRRGEQLDFAGFRFKVLRGDRRRLHTIEVAKLQPPAAE